MNEVNRKNQRAWKKPKNRSIVSPAASNQCIYSGVRFCFRLVSTIRIMFIENLNYSFAWKNFVNLCFFLFRLPFFLFVFFTIVLLCLLFFLQMWFVYQYLKEQTFWSANICSIHITLKWNTSSDTVDKPFIREYFRFARVMDWIVQILTYMCRFNNMRQYF